MDQRETHAERWHGAIRDWPGDLSLAWGLRDPVATTDVLTALRELRPSVPVTELPDLAHYPQLEDPGQIAGALRGALPPATECRSGRPLFVVRVRAAIGVAHGQEEPRCNSCLP